MKRLLGLVFLGLLAIPAQSQPWYARGEFNGWSLDNPMTDQGGGHWTADVTGLFDNQPYNWKIADADWTGATTHPGSDSRVYSDAAGELHFHLYDQTSWDDGYFPNNTRRVGYDDHQQFDWEIVGSFNGWPGGAFDPAYALTDMGGGLHRGTFTFNTGIYDFKFRGLVDQTVPPPNGVWDTSIGNDFGNTGGNNTFSVTADNQDWTFELDLPNGRFRYFTDAVPVLLGDHDGNGNVDARDYVIWRKDPASHGGAQGYTDWRANYGLTGGGGPATWLARSPQFADTPLTDQGGGIYTLNLTGLTPQADYDVQAVLSDLSAFIPGSHAKIRADASGEINATLYELDGASWGDGYSPDTTHRFGYVDHNEFDWEIVGQFNGWPATNDAAYALVDQGSGLHTGSFFFNTGTYEWKFRQIDATNPWNTSIGPDFGNAAGNNVLNVGSDGELWHFELDLPNGRWRAYLDGSGSGGLAAAPEPASVASLMLGAMLLLGAARRR